MKHFLKKLSFVCLLVLVFSSVLISKGPSSQPSVQAQTVTSPISRQQVIYNAQRYVFYEFTPSQSNIGCRTWNAYINCLGGYRWTTVCTHSDYQAGHTYYGIPYKWGGGDSLDDLGSSSCCDMFSRRLANGDLIGDTYNNWFGCPGGGQEKPVCPEAAGVDCSGFVTRVWGRPINEKYGTWTLPNISTPIPFNTDADLVRKMRMGDIFNYVGHHVVLLYYFDPYDNNRPYYYEARWEDPYIHRVLLNNGWDKISPRRNDNSGYRPYRYNEIADDANLPAIKANYNGWNSIITIRDNGGEGWSPYGAVQITFYDSNGNEVATATRPDLIMYGIWVLDASSVLGNNFSGSAVVAAEYDVSVVVQNRHSSMITAYDGIGPATSTAPDPGFAKAASTLHLPLIMRDHDRYFETWNTTIYIQNAGTATAEVYVNFYSEDGTEPPVDRDPESGTFSIPPGASLELTQSDNTDLESGFRGTAKVISLNEPVAVIVNEVQKYSEMAMAYNAFSLGAQDVYLPLSFRNWMYLNSDIPVKNIETETSVDVYYYEQGGYGEWEWHDWRDIESNELEIFDPPSGMNGRIAAAVVTNSSSDLIALLHERRDLIQYMTCNGVAKTDSMETSYVSHVPILYRDYGGWQSSIQVQNIESQDRIFVTADFFDQSGDEILFVADWVQPNRATTFYLPAITDLGDNYAGSAVVEGHSQVDYPGSHDRKVIAIANVEDFNMWGLDRGGGYNCFNR
jgi:hypothetical protein